MRWPMVRDALLRNAPHHEAERCWSTNDPGTCSPRACLLVTRPKRGTMAAPKRKPGSKTEKPAGARILVVEARFYNDIADALLAGAAKVLDEAKAAWDIITVPGSLEIVPAIAIAIAAAEKQKKP